ncbi:Uncharacterised protein [Candidatus Gugararchaeum adminiculabundum]|nr:Uncharacterised protein [Candidatus Gugararchaeum adminiculabundum]
MQGEPTREEILKSKKIEIRVQRAGIFQRQEFEIVRLKGPNGDFPVVKLEKTLSINELEKLAHKYDLPFESLSGRIFPKGKSSKDFAGL